MAFEDCTLLSVLMDHAIKNPDLKILHWVDEMCSEVDSLTYGELWKRACNVAYYLLDNLKKEGLHKGDRVMIAYPFGLQFLEGLFGCMLAGMIPCSVYPPDPSNLKSSVPKFLNLAKDANAKLALTTWKFKQAMRAAGFMGHRTGVKWVATDMIKESPRNKVNMEDLVKNLTPQDLAFIQYTSGSTSSPKGVMISHKAVLHNIFVIWKIGTEFVDCESSGDGSGHVRIASWLPQYHDMGFVIGFLIPIAMEKATGINASPIDFIRKPTLWADMIEKYHATTTVGPNFAFSLLAKRLKQVGRVLNAPSLNTASIGAEPIVPATLEGMVGMGIKPEAIVSCYGGAECVVGVAFHRGIHVDNNGVVACGEIEATEVFDKSIVVLDEKQCVLPDGEVGLIHYTGPDLASGYWGKPDENEETFRVQVAGGTDDRYYCNSGDLGFIKDGKFFVTGRAKELIIINGKNIYPTDLELSVENAWPELIRPGCSVAFQYDDAHAGLAVEARKGVSADALPSVDDIRKLLINENNVAPWYIVILRHGSVEKTTSGKRRRLETARISLSSKGWPTKSIIRCSKDTMQPAIKEDLSTTHSKKDTKPKGKNAVSPIVLGAMQGTYCPFAEVGFQEFFQDKDESTFYRLHDGILENATTRHDKIVNELQTMQEELNKGAIERSFDLVGARAANTRLWTAVPGVCPHRFALGQDAKSHDTNRPWLESSLKSGPHLVEKFRSSARSFIQLQDNSLDTADITKWTMQSLLSVIPGCSDLDPKALSRFQIRALEMMMRPETRESDDLVLEQKAVFVEELLKNTGPDMTQERANLTLDALILVSPVVAITIKCGLAVLYKATSHFVCHDITTIDERNVLAFVWESIRLFPPHEVVPWWKDGKHHVAVIGLTGRDPSLWGEDVDEFRPSRATPEVFDQKSCFFAEPATGYSCAGKQIALDMACSFILEISKASSWSCVEDDVRYFNSSPYFEEFHLQKNPKAIIVGAGAAGLSCALTLAKRGVKVTVLERNASIGGHARHVEVFGHVRNPAFGAFNEHQYPNLVRLTDELGVERIPLCSFRNFRRNFVSNGGAMEDVDEREIVRFLSDMSSIQRGTPVPHAEAATLGDYLEAAGFDEKFIVGFVLEVVVHFFAGLKVGEYLETPLSLAAWIVTGDVKHDPDATVFRLRNKEYMEAFRSRLSELGVEIITGCAPQVIERSSAGVKVSIGKNDDSVVFADQLFMAIPPHAAAEVLHDTIRWEEGVLGQFDCRSETVVLHTDPSFVMSNSQAVLYGSLPISGVLPPLEYTIPMTTKIKSDTDHETDIYVTHAYDSFSKLGIKGSKEYMSFMHTRITTETMKLRKILETFNGSNHTHFIGGWTRGFMLHEDALASGIEAANNYLRSFDRRPEPVLERAVEIPANVRHTSKDVADSLQLVDKKIHNVISEELRLSSSGGFPIEWLFEGDLSIDELESRISSKVGAGSSTITHRPKTATSYELWTQEELLRTVIRCLHEVTDLKAQPTDRMGSMGLASIDVVQVYDSIVSALDVEKLYFKVEWFFEDDLTVQDLVKRIYDGSGLNARNEASTHLAGSVPSRPVRIPYSPPRLVAFVNDLFQVAAVVAVIVFVASIFYPTVLFWIWAIQQWGPMYTLLTFPLTTVLFTLSSGLILVVTKWCLLGRQKPTHTAIWSGLFARRWVVRQCSRVCFNITPWAYLGGTPALSLLYRMLGCQIGTGASLSTGCIVDYDLATVGENAVIEGIIRTESITLGVQTTTRTSIGPKSFISDKALIMPGVEIGSNCFVEERCTVPPGSRLASSTAWRGKPAAQFHSDFMSKNENRPRPRRRAYLWTTQIVTILIFSSYLWAVELSVSFAVIALIWSELGWVGLALLVWVPSTASLLVSWLFVSTAKWIALGKVRPGVWPPNGSFHCRKWAIDHLVKHHLIRWVEITSLLGFPLGMYSKKNHWILRSLGSKVGNVENIASGMDTAYDLFTVADGVIFGGGSSVHPFRGCEAKEISIGTNVFIGTTSAILGGTVIHSGAAVAGHSVARGEVLSHQTVVDTEILARNDNRETEEKLLSNTTTASAAEILASLLALVSTALIVCLLWVVSSTADSTIESFKGLESSVQALVLVIVIGSVVSLLLPLYLTLALICFKLLLVGRHKQGLMAKASFRFFRAHAIGRLQVVFSSALRENLPGTSLEIFYNRRMGADIGNHVYLDGVYFFEPDLITVGAHTSILGPVGVAPHRVDHSTTQFAPLTIGKRCTIEFDSTFHGNGLLEDDTTLCGTTMPLIGSKLTSGIWRGYPAARVGDVGPSPPQPSNPIWYVVLLRPSLLVHGCYSWIFLFFCSVCTRACYWRKGTNEQIQQSNSKEIGIDDHHSNGDVPTALKGTFVSREDNGKHRMVVSFEKGEWVRAIRLLKVPNEGMRLLSAPSHPTVETEFRQRVSYEWTFDASFSSATGRISLLCWAVPLEVVRATLVKSPHADDGWVLGYSWFDGEPQTELLEKVAVTSQPPV